jgi:hypothetical protein
VPDCSRHLPSVAWLGARLPPCPTSPRSRSVTGGLDLRPYLPPASG